MLNGWLDICWWSLQWWGLIQRHRCNLVLEDILVLYDLIKCRLDALVNGGNETWVDSTCGKRVA